MNSGRLFILDAVMLIILQAIIGSMLDISVYVEIIILPIYILHLPMRTGTPVLLISAFLTGIAADLITNDITGLYTASLVPLAFLRGTVTRLTTSKKRITSYSDIELAEMPPASTVPYYVVSTFLFSLIYFGLEAVFVGDDLMFFLGRMTASFIVNSILTTLSGLYIFRK